MSSALTGPQRYPRNMSIDEKGSIHDDSTAKAIGFRGGTVAGDVHLDQFAPLLLEAFGPKWFETGCLSMMYRYATTDGEPVIAFLGRPTADDDTQVRAWMETPDGVVVCEGTASVGNPESPSALQSFDRRRTDASSLRILRTVDVGAPLERCVLEPREADQRARIETGRITEPLDWYVGPSPWGGPIASPLTTAQLLHWEPVQPLARTLPKAVGLFGAIEIRYRNGPVRLGETYTVTGVVVDVADSPKTEILWYDTEAVDAIGTTVATCRMMTRFVKASTPLYER